MNTVTVDSFTSDRASLLEGVAGFAAGVLGTTTCELISDSNNLVFLVRAGARRLVLKLILDGGIDLDSVLAAERAVASAGVPVPRTLMIDQSLHTLPVPVLVQEYVHGQSLSDILVREPRWQSPFADLAVSVIHACEVLLPPSDGRFGYLKRDRGRQVSVAEFYKETSGRYISRIRGAGLFGAGWLDVVQRELVARIGQVCRRYPRAQIVPIDVNLKNFLVSDANQLVMLNVPLLAYTCEAHGVASFAFQLRGLGGREQLFRALAARKTSHASTEDVACFEALAALGVLSFYAKVGVDAMRSATAWGSSTLLVDLLLDALNEGGVSTVPHPFHLT